MISSPASKLTFGLVYRVTNTWGSLHKVMLVPAPDELVLMTPVVLSAWVLGVKENVQASTVLQQVQHRQEAKL
jgi:hypothetical protein